MRSFLAGLLGVGVTLSLGAAAFAQVKGEVVSIGLGPEGYYRPNCWTPMVVRLTATTSSPFVGKLVVKQADLDGDHVSYERPINLGGNTEGTTQTAPFWMYFLPSPTLGKAMSYSLGAQPGQPSELDKAVQVFICDADGKQLRQLHITQGIQNLDAVTNTGMGTGAAPPHRGKKLVLCVAGNDRAPSYDPALLGLAENVVAVGLPINSISTALPDSILGYEAVDAVLWMDAQPSRLDPGDKQARALREYVRRGGQLVILHGGDAAVWADVATRFNDLMPVNVKRVAEIHHVETLKKIHREYLERFYAGPRGGSLQWHLNNDLPAWDPLAKTAAGDANTFPIAVADAKPGALVDHWINDPTGAVAGPYIVRSRFGLGSVTWVAQDVADGNYGGRFDKTVKWAPVWDRIFDWQNVPFLKDANTFNNSEPKPYGEASTGTTFVELDAHWISRMDLENTGAALVGLAVLFFIIYWVIAGPGAYIFLAAKKKAGLNWFAFALAALIATGVTVLIVKAVLRGSARARHLSFVRIAPGEPAVVRTQFGLYVPKDGYRTITIKDPDKQARPESNWNVTPYAIHSSYYDTASTFTAPLDYSVPVMDAKTVEIPYRSTLKRLQAQWTGAVAGLDGSVSLPATKLKDFDKEGFITGSLANNTGYDLHHVYFVFNRPDMGANDDTPPGAAPLANDLIFYTSDWPKGTLLDLGATFKNKSVTSSNLTKMSSGAGYFSWGFLGRVDNHVGWQGVFLNRDLRKSAFGGTAEEWDENNSNFPRAFVMMSLFDRLPVMRADESTQDTPGRADLGRLGSRYMDVSHAVSAGSLVVLAEAPDTRLPVPIEVDGNPITVEPHSTTYYQFILPLDRSALADFNKPVPATRPVTGPAMTPATHPVSNPAIKPATMPAGAPEPQPAPRSATRPVRAPGGRGAPRVPVRGPEVEQ